MSKLWSRILWAFVFIYLAGMLALWLIPEKVKPNDALPDELRTVEERVLSARSELSGVHLDKAVAKSNRVVAVFVTWQGSKPYSFRDRQAWNSEARKIALIIGSRYVPADWHVNVVLYYKSKRLPRGLYGISAQNARNELAKDTNDPSPEQ